MKNNRRNYYRILHVQPEAPLDVIRASFRSLMLKLRQHPDLGGDHETAVLLNEAYAVLSDPVRRRQYDQTQPRSRGTVSAPPRTTVAPKALPQPGARESPRVPVAAEPASGPRTYSSVLNAAYGKRAHVRPERTSDSPLTCCPFCGFAAPAVVQRDTRCRRCDSPLAQPAGAGGADEASSRRMLPRVSKTDVVLLHESWQQPPYSARLRDLSLSGISVITDFALPVDMVIRIVGPSFDVLAAVVSCRRNGESYSLHARLASAIFAERAGVFVSMTA